jgi:hypothetical protein
MLDLYKCARIFACSAYKSVLLLVFSLSSLHAFEYQDGLEAIPRPLNMSG